ncbi:MAG: Crp/Fnr family transcriptional regulator [Proteobacteria bacterium]|nr:Crp/Fnr family transcriptional regulator [Pseudomonadota bacterium]
MKSAPIFERLSPGDLNKIIATSSAETRPSGCMLFSQGEQATAFFVVIAGWVKLVRDLPSGVSTVIDVAGARAAIGVAVAAARSAHVSSAYAVTPVRLLRFESAAICSVIRNNPSVALAFIHSAAHLHRSLIEDIEKLKSFKAVERVAAFLASLTQQREGRATVRLPFGKTLLAARLGIQPESLSRAFRQLRDKGVLVVRDGVVIADIGRLKQAVDTESGAYLEP